MVYQNLCTPVLVTRGEIQNAFYHTHMTGGEHKAPPYRLMLLGSGIWHLYLSGAGSTSGKAGVHGQGVFGRAVVPEGSRVVNIAGAGVVSAVIDIAEVVIVHRYHCPRRPLAHGRRARRRVVVTPWIEVDASSSGTEHPGRGRVCVERRAKPWVVGMWEENRRVGQEGQTRVLTGDMGESRWRGGVHSPQQVESWRCVVAVKGL